MAKVLSIEVGYGASVCIKENWHRFDCTVAVQVEEGDNLAEVKETAWNTVYAEVEKQVKEVLSPA